MTRLHDVRVDRGITQAELAERAGVSLRTLQDYEQGSKDLNRAAAETVVRIARALCVRVEDLVG